MFVEWCLVVPVCIVCVLLMNRIRAQHLTFITWMGIVSLESYLANIYLKETIKEIVGPFTHYTLLKGGYLEYGTVIVGGFLLAYLANYFSSYTLKHIR